VEEVLKAVTGVNWRRLGKGLIEEENSLYTKLDRIHDEYESDEARLRAVVEEFLNRPVPWRTTLWRTVSWRKMIWTLYCADEIDKAQQIRNYAEPLQGVMV
jgi:hypothetical protein